MDIAKLAADPELAKGKWFPFEDDVEFLIAYGASSKYRKKQQRLLMKARLSRGDRDITEISESVNIETLFKTVLLDWKGLTENGQPFEFTLENAKRFLMAPNGALNFILAEANTKANFQEASDEAEEDDDEPATGKKGTLPADQVALKSGA